MNPKGASPKATARSLLERIADALEKIASREGGANETVDAKGAAAILKCSVEAVYVRYKRGQLPPPIPSRSRRLLWRKGDLLRGA